MSEEPRIFAWLVDVLADSELTTTEIRAKTKKSYSVVTYALTMAFYEGRVERRLTQEIGAPWRWRLA